MNGATQKQTRRGTMNTFYQVCLTTKGTMAFAKATKALFVYIVCANFVIIVVKKNQSQSHALRGLLVLAFDEIYHAKLSWS